MTVAETLLSNNDTFSRVICSAFSADYSVPSVRFYISTSKETCTTHYLTPCSTAVTRLKTSIPLKHQLYHCCWFFETWGRDYLFGVRSLKSWVPTERNAVNSDFRSRKNIQQRKSEPHATL